MTATRTVAGGGFVCAWMSCGAMPTTAAPNVSVRIVRKMSIK
jgi:hypothetical protein